jgi:hypothetical protein
MKTALYLGGDNGVHFSAGFYRNNPPCAVKFQIWDWEMEDCLVIVSLMIWKFGIQLLWLR